MTRLSGMPVDEYDGDRRRLIEGELPGLGQHTDLLLRLLDDFVGTGRGNADAIISQAARGVLFEGPSGSGKTALAKAVGKYGGLPFHYLSCPSLFGTDRGDAERGVLGVFHACADEAAASDRGACLLILDEVESIGKDRTRARHVLDLGVLAMFLECFDRPAFARVFVVGIAGDASLIDPSLMQPGRLEVTLSLAAPTLQQRQAILQNLLSRLNTVLNDDGSRHLLLLDSLTRRTRGFTGADLSRLCTDALSSAHRRCSSCSSPTTPNHIQIHDEDWESALESARPIDIPWSSPEGAQLSDLAGMDDLIRTVSEAALLPLSRPDALAAMGVPRASFGVLLHGPAGTGKSTLGRALAMAASPYASFLAVECPELVNKVVGESERAVARLFQTARQAAPCILLLDHVEAIAGRRGFDSSTEQTMDRLLSTLLVEMDGLGSGGGGGGGGGGNEMIVVVAATNHLSMLDDAILRPGRLDLHMEMGLPDVEGRRAIYLHHLARSPISFDEAEGEEEEEEERGWKKFASLAELAKSMAEMSEGLSGADIQGVCQEAALLGLREDLDRTHLLPKHVLQALAVQRGG